MGYTNLLYSIRFTIVILSCILSFIIRLFANIVSEPIIHEFDPHFNWRCTQYADKHGLYEFLNWYDNISWYPQGRPVGETSYPGMMFTSAIIKWILQRFHIIIDLKMICIYNGPIFAVFSTILAYLFGQLFDEKIQNDSNSKKKKKSNISALGCFFSALIAFIPGLISRSVAGSYDYESMSIFVLNASIYFFCYALKHGSLIAAMLSGLVYGYMSLSWGGYVFLSNCIPLFTMGMIVLGRYSWRLHITYSVWAVIGSLLSTSVPFIGDKIVKKPEHFAMFGVFLVIQLWGLLSFLKLNISVASFNSIIVTSILIIPIFVLVFIAISMSIGFIGGFSGRLMQLFDPSYASKNIPIIASVAEHQPSAWGLYYLDCGILIGFFPLGCFFILKNKLTRNTEGAFLVLIYGLSTLYFASIMVRLVIIFTPAFCFVTGIGMHNILSLSFRTIAAPNKHKSAKSKKKQIKENENDECEDEDYTDDSKSGLAWIIIISLFVAVLSAFLQSCYFCAVSYSGDHIHFDVTSPTGPEGSDDYREGYRWLFENTHRDDRVMSWWDYGYQITSMGNRGCLADGNTNNFTHIGIIGMTMSSPQEVSWRLARMMNANYMLVIFGGACGYDGDDLNKFMWMPKIANQTFHNISGSMYQFQPFYPIIGNWMTKNMTTSMMFSLSYHNFKRYDAFPMLPRGLDLTRQVQVPHLEKINLKLFEEAFTSKHWIVRLYRVKPDPLWDKVY